MEQAELFAPLIDSAQRQVVSLLDALRMLRRRQRDYRVGGLGERAAASRLQQVLVGLGSSDWHLLADRRWPGSRRANLDLLVVGPPGVIVLDAKTWSEPRIASGSLWCGQVNADEEIDKARSAADAVAAALADVGLAPAAVHPMLLLVGSRAPAVDLGGVTVLGEHALQPALVRLGPRLHAAQVSALVAALADACPPAGTGHTVTVPAPPDRPTATSASEPAREDVLFDVEGVLAATVAAAMREPIEAWMTWLHPAQAGLVARHYSGPARIRGAAGTGKTVVALHRARHLARQPGARVLVTSYVRTLPAVHRALFTRLAPELVRRVEFCGLHSWAARLLHQRGLRVRMAERGGRDLFDRAWTEVAAGGCLAALPLSRDYWWDEVRYVVKGRALATREEYVTLERIGRRTPLREEHRAAVWALCEAYDAKLAAAGTCDYADLLTRALDAVRAEPLATVYTAVVVDEVQDLTCVGLRLLHALVGDVPDGLLLVGDGQQAVYPGGFSLSEAGVAVAGRATVLDVNYRNATDILQAAFGVIGDDAFDDLDTGPVSGQRRVSVAHTGGHVLRVRARDEASQRAALIDALEWARRDGVRAGDIAVLVPDNRRATTWATALNAAGIGTQLLRDYDGTTTDLVKVGTYQRAQGLEFACVFLPDHDRTLRPSAGASDDDSRQLERLELERRQLFVAMTRARDRLWLGSQV
jgi:hypothetical protein